MHTYTGKGCRIHFNSDLSGEVHITKESGASIIIPAVDIVGFMEWYKATYTPVERVVREGRAHIVHGEPFIDEEPVVAYFPHNEHVRLIIERKEANGDA